MALLFLLLSKNMLFTTGNSIKESAVVAKVGSQNITVAQLKTKIASESRFRSTPADKQKVLEEMIEFEMLYEAALKMGLEKDEEVMYEYKQLLGNKAKERVLTPTLFRTVISNQEIKAYYQRHISEFTRPEKARFAIIFIEYPPMADPEGRDTIRNKILRIRNEIISTGDPGAFSDAAKTYSDDPKTAYKGGLTDWIIKGGKHPWNEQVIETGFSLKYQDDVSNVIETREGCYLIKLIERRDEIVTPVGQVRDHIRRTLVQDKRRIMEKQFLKELRKDVEVEIHSNILDAVQPPPIQGHRSAN